MEQVKIIEGILTAFLFFGYVLLWKLKRNMQYKETGIDPEVIYSDTRPTQMYFSALSRIMTVSIIILILLHTIGVSNIFGFQGVVILENRSVDLLGFGIGLSGLMICYLAQRAMGNAWRVGIDQKIKTDLITTGMFRVVRNPTYSGIFFLCIGVWLIFPSMSILAWSLVLFAMIEFQVRFEEEFLGDRHKEKYFDYCSNTKRYLPYIY